MNRIWLVMRREFLNRVQKKSFLVATILIPLIFPAIISIMIYAFVKQQENAAPDVIELLDTSGKISLENSKHYTIVTIHDDLQKAKTDFLQSKDFALLYIPPFELSSPDGFVLYTKENPSLPKINDLEGMLAEQIRTEKLHAFNISQQAIDSLKTEVSLKSVNLTDTGQEKVNNNGVLYGLGFVLGILIYIFVMVYGMQIMHGVIEEKTSKVVEVIVSSVKPFQLMTGKILGIAAVGLLQFTIWVLLVAILSTASLAYFGVNFSQQQTMEQVTHGMNNPQMQQAIDQNTQAVAAFKSFMTLPFGWIIYNFAFYFLGGYLLYGALFAAVGSSVDSQQEAQQFTLPVIMPLIISYIALFMFILNDPHGSVSFWFSIIPFTSPVAMVGRLAFDVPTWQLILSQVLLVGGFIFTTWVAGRIYRIGILTHGSKVNYKVLAKWFTARW